MIRWTYLFESRGYTRKKDDAPSPISGSRGDNAGLEAFGFTLDTNSGHSEEEEVTIYLQFIWICESTVVLQVLDGSDAMSRCDSIMDDQIE